MSRWLLALILAPVSLALPWLIPAVQRRWGLAIGLLIFWLCSGLVMFFMWFGPGVIGLAATGLIASYLTKV